VKIHRCIAFRRDRLPL